MSLTYHSFPATRPPMANPRTTTAYQHIAEDLRRQVLEGKLPPGERLPPERELCVRYAASRITIRRALAILADERLIDPRQGLGTFVSPTPTRHIPLLSSDFSGSMASHAPDAQRVLQTQEWRPAPAQVAVALETFVGANVLFARRIDMLRGESVAFDETYFPESVADRISADDLSQVRFLERWQAVQQIRIGRVSQQVEAMIAGADEAAILNVPKGFPLLKEVDVIYLTMGAPCGLFVSYYRHDLFQLRSTVWLNVAPEGADAPVTAATTVEVG